MRAFTASVAGSLLVGAIASVAAGCLDMQSKVACVTSADCLAPNRCIVNRCVADADGGDFEPAFVAVRFDQSSTRYFTADGDWSPGNLKAQCPAEMYVNGISAVSNNLGPLLLAHSALCQHSTEPIDHTSERTYGNNGDLDDRGDTATGDWDPGNQKIECGPSEVITGVAQTASLVFGVILCSESQPGPDPGRCVSLYFSHDMNDRLSTDSGDWAFEYVKNECGAQHVLKGISTAAGELHGVLCCERMAPPP
jgi:hypothetical protein